MPKQVDKRASVNGWGHAPITLEGPLRQIVADPESSNSKSECSAIFFIMRVTLCSGHRADEAGAKNRSGATPYDLACFFLMTRTSHKTTNTGQRTVTVIKNASRSCAARLLTEPTRPLARPSTLARTTCTPYAQLFSCPILRFSSGLRLVILCDHNGPQHAYI
jgi:hypothetical protein